MPHFDFTADNIGSPEPYTVQGVCKRITIQEKLRTAATLSTYRVYEPSTAVAGKARLIGEPHIITAQDFFYPANKPFALETISQASAVFTITEE